MGVTQVAYEVEGWGVGELWLEGQRVLWHDLPFPRATAPNADGGELVERIRAYFAGRPDSFDDVDLDLEYETPFLERCALFLEADPPERATIAAEATRRAHLTRQRPSPFGREGIAQAVLDRCARKGESRSCIQSLDCPGLFGGRILDRLCFVEDN